jgi:integrase
MRKRKGRADGVYQRKDRGNSYWISWQDAQGRRRQRKTDAHTLEQARSALASERLRAETAKTLGFNPPGEETFSDVSAKYLKHQKARLSVKAYDRTRGTVENQLNTAFAGKIANIRRMDVQAYVTRRLANVSPGSVIRELGILKHLLNYAVENEFIPANPAATVKPPKAPAGRVRYLQPPELKALLEVCPDWLRAPVALAATTGMRRGEILGLRWLHVDLENSRLWLPQTKNGTGRVVYLNATAKAALSSLQREGEAPGALVFDLNADVVTHTFKSKCTDLGIVDFRFHDLRHTAASWMRMSGVDLHTVATLLGHKDLRMTARYSHLSPDFLGEAVNKLDSVFGVPRDPGVTTPKLLDDGAPVKSARKSTANGTRTRSLRLERAAC